MMVGRVTAVARVMQLTYIQNIRTRDVEHTWCSTWPNKHLCWAMLIAVAV